MTIALGIYVTATLSGAHFNPAVTITMAVTGRHPWRLVPLYIACQIIGWFLGAAVLMAMFARNLFDLAASKNITTAATATSCRASSDHDREHRRGEPGCDAQPSPGAAPHEAMLVVDVRRRTLGPPRCARPAAVGPVTIPLPWAASMRRATFKRLNLTVDDLRLRRPRGSGDARDRREEDQLRQVSPRASSSCVPLV